MAGAKYPALQVQVTSVVAGQASALKSNGLQSITWHAPSVAGANQQQLVEVERSADGLCIAQDACRVVPSVGAMRLQPALYERKQCRLQLTPSLLRCCPGTLDFCTCTGPLRSTSLIERNTGY